MEPIDRTINEDGNVRQRRPKLGFWEIWNMSLGFLGIQFGFALQNANVSRIFQTLGAEIDSLAILWVAAPLTGLIVQPIVGYFSDNTWGKLGRRRPYFLVGAILASIALIFMPNAGSLWIAVGMLWILDTSINVSMEPFRAFVGDNLPEEQRNVGFATQSFFIGLGAVVASILPYLLANVLGISNVAEEGAIPDSVKWSFYLGAIAFFGAVLWTVVMSKEYSPEQLKAFDGIDEDEALILPEQDWSRQNKWGVIFLIIGLLLSAVLALTELGRENKDLYILGGGFIVFGIGFLLSVVMKRNGNGNDFSGIVDGLLMMPQKMQQLALVQFFSWFALFAMWIYTTATVTKTVFGSDDPTSQAYNDGADWVSIGFAVYNGVAALVAFLLPVLAKRMGRKGTHAFALILGALSLASIFLFPGKNIFLVTMLGIGIAWASILSLPYAMLTGALPASRMGYFMGVFNFFIVIPQILAAAVLGFLLRTFFDSDPGYALLIGAGSFVVAAVFTMKVSD